VRRHATTTEQVHALVPLKTIKKSKTRLTTLTSRDREKLTVAMLSNVLTALANSRNVSTISVVSADKSALRIVRRYGADFLSEGRRHGLNPALRLAIRKLEQGAVGTVMIIHADLPLVTAEDIDRFLDRAKGSKVALVPCKNETGTNALLLTPPSAIPLVFGKGSFKTYLWLAKKARFQPKVLKIRGIRFDIDDPQDLCEFIHGRKCNETFRFLSKSCRKTAGHPSESNGKKEKEFRPRLRLSGQGGRNNNREGISR
jgi:2-phospho-L-lactate/phosphoenolpyruvate guanylyltransferase